MVINSLLDTDLYKLTMQQCALHRFSNVKVKYAFKCRNKHVDLAPHLAEIQEEISSLCSLKLSEDELEYLRSLSFISEDFVDFLRTFKLSKKFISVTTKGKELLINIEGPWLHTLLFEVPILAIVNEVYFKHASQKDTVPEGLKRLNEKIALIEREAPSNFVFADFGTRRRFSAEWQDILIRHLKRKLPSFTGTSNVLLAKKYKLTPIGTMAHEFLQAAQALVRVQDSQKFAFQQWAEEYRGKLGIALSDVVGMDAFLKDFDLYFCKLYDGARHDSGDPIVWCEKLIRHYENNGIDPKTKTAVFSDGLTFPKALALAKEFEGRIKTSFGIGTNLTNDMGITPLQIVIKMVECNGQPVAKISDSQGKEMCKDKAYLTHLKGVFNIK